MISPGNAPLKLAPKAFNGVGMSNSPNILPLSVATLSMSKAILAERVVDGVFVGMNNRSRLNVFMDDREDRIAFDIGGNGGLNVPASFDHAEDNGFPRCAAPDNQTLRGRTHFNFPSNIGFVHLDMVLKRLFRFFIKEKSDLLSHSPGGLIGNADLSLNLHSGHPILGVSKQPDSEEPGFKGSVGLMEDSSGKGMKLMAAKLAGITFTSRHFIKLGFLVAFGTHFKRAITLLKDIVQAGFVMGIFGVKVADRKFIGHGLSPLGLLSDSLIIAKKCTCCQGIVTTNITPTNPLG